MTRNTGLSPGTRHNKKIRGTGPWGSEVRRLDRYQQRKFRREMGLGTWSSRVRRLDRNRRRREVGAWAANLRSRVKTVVIGAVIFSALLVLNPATRATGMMILFVGAVLYVVTRRKKA